MRGEVIHMRLFDLGEEVDLEGVTRMHGAVPSRAPLVTHSPSPPTLRSPTPLEVVFAVAADRGQAVRVELRLHGVGVLAVRARWAVEAEAVGSLGELAQALRIGGQPFEAYAEGLAGELRGELGLPAPSADGVEPERYLVYALHLAPGDVPDLLQRERAALAQLVADAPGESLVPERLASAWKHTLQYTPGDAAIFGWDHAVVLDGPGEYEDILDVIELANLELLEFRSYDADLDRKLESSFVALDRLWARGGLFRSARTALAEISKLRVRFARLTDNLHDTGKLFGDWYTAQMHRHLHERFHLASWEKAVASKMETLEDLFHLAQEEANHRRTLILEVMVVVLFVLDLAILLRVP
ncbi:MAG: hypothetical protein ACYC2H_02480 [Thermoplasmatota archaeon]